MKGTAPLPLKIKAQAFPEKDPDRKKKEYAAIFAVFEEFVREYETADSEDIIGRLSELRAEFAMRYAVEGFDMEWEEALDLLAATEDLSTEEQKKRDVLVAAVENIVDFAVAEEYHCVEEALDVEEGADEEDILYAICERFNMDYANVEDMDIEYAMMMAAALVGVDDATWLMYETQRDDRVRPWHAIYDGFMAPKYMFPEWLIPPIEWNCRCFLSEVNPLAKARDVRAEAAIVPQMPDWFDRTFEESVAMGGRIFSEHHPYFTIEEEDREWLEAIADRIKAKYIKVNG